MLQRTVGLVPESGLEERRLPLHHHPPGWHIGETASQDPAANSESEGLKLLITEQQGMAVPGPGTELKLCWCPQHLTGSWAPALCSAG